MRILLDECVPWPMHKLLGGHECTIVQQRGWGGIKNGDLLRRVEDDFDLFVNTDHNIRYQQNVAGCRIPILELSTNDLRRIRVAAAEIQAAVSAIKPSEFRRLEIPRT